MYCKNCEKEFKKGKFCPKCGEKLIDNDEFEEELEEDDEVENEDEESVDDEKDEVEKEDEKNIDDEKEEVENEVDDDEEEDDNVDDNEYDETVRQVKEKAMKAAGVAMSFGKALTNYAKKTTDEFIKNSQNGNLQKSIESKLEKFINGEGNTKKLATPTEDFDVLKKKLQTLKEMKDEGLLSIEEYEEKRNMLLNKDKSVKEEKKEVKREDKINKCPNCGEIVNAFDVKCPSCGFELRGKSKSTKLDDFSNKMDDIDTELEEEDNNIGFDIFGIAAKKRKEKASVAIRKKIEYIKNEPIPNTKEDIIEFMFLASSNINTGILYKDASSSYNMGLSREEFKNEKLMSEAWYSKMEQAYHKAEILLKDDVSFERIKKIYDDKIAVIKKEKIKFLFFNPVAKIVYFMLFWLLLMFLMKCILIK